MKKFLELSSWSRKAIGAMLIVAFAVVGCDDDDSWSPSARPNDEPGVESSSSSATQSNAKQSSSSEKTGVSSGSVEDASSSSVKSESSSSVEKPKSSSSKDPELAEGSSSSEAASESSSSISELSSSSLKFDWSLPKEAYLNPDIVYGTMTDERDGKVYRTVKIGTQTWMAENLNYDAGQGGSGEDNYDWSWCFNNEPKNCDVAGRLYTWAAAIDSVKLANDADNSQNCGYDKTCNLDLAGPAPLIQGVCPPGWHLPNTMEWDALFMAVFTSAGSLSTVGEFLKSLSGWYGDGNGTDAFGFSALPAGKRWRRYDNALFYDDGGFTYFWSASEDNRSRAYLMCLYFKDKGASLGSDYKYYGYSVRCVKD